MTKWLVTGGAGFIGGALVRMLARRNDDVVTVLDSMTYAADLRRLDGLDERGRVHVMHADTANNAVVGQLIADRDIDVIVHLAAESHVDRSILGSEPFLHSNVVGTHSLLEAARAAWGSDVSGRRFLHVSTDEVFGMLAPDEPPFTESSPYRPSSPYSATKAASDHLVRAWHETYGLPTIVTNCSNNYGPWQYPEKLIPLVIHNALEGREIPVYGDGLQVRDWLHVDDHCGALLAVAHHGRPGRDYAIGGRCERTNLWVVSAICAAIDELRGLEPGTSGRLIRHVQDRPGHDTRYAIDCSRIESELGWRASHLLDQEIPGLVAWYAGHGDWFESVGTPEYDDYYRRQYPTARDTRPAEEER